VASNVAITGANTDQQTNSTGVAAPSDFAVNLPATTGSGEGGALGFSLVRSAETSTSTSASRRSRIPARCESFRRRRSRWLNNKQAKISQGVSIPISVVSAAGTSTQFVQADLSLTVTPYVSQRDCAIAMNLVVTKNEPDFVNVGARGDPTILRKEARTDMLVNDGETTVLGGIYTRNSGVAYKKIPLLAIFRCSAGCSRIAARTTIVPRSSCSSRRRSRTRARYPARENQLTSSR